MSELMTCPHCKGAKFVPTEKGGETGCAFCNGRGLVKTKGKLYTQSELNELLEKFAIILKGNHQYHRKERCEVCKYIDKSLAEFIKEKGEDDANKKS